MRSSLIRTALILVAITVVSWLAVDTIYTALTPPPTAVKQSLYQAVESVPSRKADSSRPDHGVILRRNLFGSVQKEADAPEVTIDVDALEHTKLNLVLLGTVAGSNGFDYAVIEERGRRDQALYREGDTVSGARLVKIMRTRVVLRVEDRDEVLSMAEADRDRTATAPAARLPAPAGQPTGDPSEQVITLDRGNIDAAVQDMGRLMTDARIRPFFSGGQVDGLMISNIVPGSVFQQLGLRNGDVVQGVDGRPLRSPNDLMAVYQSLESGSEVSVNIKRRGRDELLQYRFED